MEETFPSHSNNKKDYLHCIIIFVVAPLKTSHHPTLQDTRPVNGSNDKMSLCDIKKAIEDNERETEEVNEDEDEDSKAEHDAQKAWYWHPNTTCGTVREKTYFKVILDYRWVCFDVGKQTDNNNNDSGDKDETTPSSQAQLPKIKFKIGDYAKLSRGKAGMVNILESIGFELGTMAQCGERNILKSI
ncbi:hypothetical protein RFI_26693 [Reticulomyxa filosa]|uniref:Uncharacterized protein n=1 Tax=Reticulomyxa filosa TaxID=46433 RepID=X6M9V9_RETFI|nr:hypothetical protein RFI_26693 [Reticulomyxa filosa]|eukprot:ETO10684.1 hypothetical protein RFI_26693 [Reticulomyxa filosa]